MKFFYVIVKVDFCHSFQLQLLLSYWIYHCNVPHHVYTFVLLCLCRELLSSKDWSWCYWAWW